MGDRSSRSHAASIKPPAMIKRVIGEIGTEGTATVTLALAVFPVPPSVAVTLPVVLFLAPAVVPVTLTDTVQLALAASVPADRLTEEEPATAVGVPPQVLFKFGVAATTNPAGSVSVNATPVRPIVFGFCTVKVSDVVPFSGMLVAPNASLMIGGDATVRLALAVFPVPPFVDVTLPVVLFWTPAVVPVTLTDNVQLLLAGTVPPARLTEPATAVGVPPQVLVKFGVAAASPAGSVSVNAAPTRLIMFEFGFCTVNVSDVVPFSGM